MYILKNTKTDLSLNCSSFSHLVLSKSFIVNAKSYFQLLYLRRNADHSILFFLTNISTFVCPNVLVKCLCPNVKSVLFSKESKSFLASHKQRRFSSSC